MHITFLHFLGTVVFARMVRQNAWTPIHVGMRCLSHTQLGPTRQNYTHTHTHSLTNSTSFLILTHTRTKKTRTEKEEQGEEDTPTPESLLGEPPLVVLSTTSSQELAPQASPSLHLPPQAHGGDRHRSPPLSGRPPWYGETPLEAHLLPPPSHDLTHELPSANA